MKGKRNRRSLFLLLAVSLGGAAAFAQADFRPGYIVNLAGDTLRGEYVSRKIR